MTESKQATLVLEDGRVFRGQAFGADGEAFGEMVFNTSMTGYQEILTDPSYAGQIVCMTYPLIGNYGVNHDDVESRKPWAEGFVVKEVSEVVSNWRSTDSLDSYLKENGIIGIEKIDTRALVRHIRDKGAMRAVISTVEADVDKLLSKVLSSPAMENRELASEVTSGSSYEFPSVSTEKFHVVAYDFGVKTNSLREFSKFGCRTTVVPSSAAAADVLSRLLAQGVEVHAVLARPDAPAGRGRSLNRCEVALVADRAGIEVYQPASLRDPQSQAWLTAQQPDVILVVAYGLMIPKHLLNLQIGRAHV